MSTSQEDTSPANDTHATPGEEGTESPEATSRATAISEAGGAFLSGTPIGAASASSGLFAAETFSVIGLLLFALATAHTRLFELFSWFFLGSVATAGNAQQTSMFSAEVIVAGGLSALAVLAGAVSLFLGDTATRAWSRWSAAAIVVVGSLLVLVSVLTFMSLLRVS